jgi:protein involved in polysaccharide export with SLBB domain
VFKRAGGLTNFAFAKGTIFMREELKVREQEQIDRLATRLQSQLTTTQAAVAASDKGASAAAGGAAAAALVAQLRSTKPVGRLVVDIPALLRQGEGSDVDVTLHNSDRIYVPRETQEVTVLGEVQNPTSHLFRRGMTSATAIALSGGYSEGADKKRAYVIRADGSVAVAPEGWFAGKQVPLQAGDSVVVPIDAQKLPPLMEWSTVSSILSNLVVATSGLKFIGIL